MSMVYFFVPGKVQGKARPRFSSRSGTVYTPGKTKSYERQIAEAYEAQHGPCFEGAVMVVIEAVFSIPKSWTRAKKAEAMAGKLPPGKPDIDNILKVVLDGLNCVAYEDDKQVVLTQCKKVYADTTRPAGLQVHVFQMDNAKRILLTREGLSMIDTTGSLLSRQVRRKIERQKNKNATLTVKPEYLKDLCAQAVKQEAAKLATHAKNEAVSRLFEELIAIPVMVIHDHFGELMKKDGREERFAEMCLELYDTVEKGFVTPAELRQCLFEEAGVRFKHPSGSLASERKEATKV